MGWPSGSLTTPVLFHYYSQREYPAEESEGDSEGEDVEDSLPSPPAEAATGGAVGSHAYDRNLVLYGCQTFQVTQCVQILNNKSLFF